MNVASKRNHVNSNQDRYMGTYDNGRKPTSPSTATTCDARTGKFLRNFGLTDAEGHRLWSVTDRPVPGNRAHAEIQREPRGKVPNRAERDRFVEVWRGATVLLTTLKKEDPSGTPELQVVPDSGVEVHWRSGQDKDRRRVVQVESVAEAIRAYGIERQPK